MLCQLDKAINNVANWEERYSFQPLETKLSSQTVNQLFYLSQQNCLTINLLCGKNIFGKKSHGKDVYGKEAHSKNT